MSVLKSPNFYAKEEIETNLKGNKHILELSGKINLILECLILLHYKPFTDFIYNCGGRCFQIQLIDYIQRNYKHIKSKHSEVIERMCELNIIEKEREKCNGRNILALTYSVMPLYDKNKLQPKSIEGMYKAAYVGWQQIYKFMDFLGANDLQKIQQFFDPKYNVSNLKMNNIYPYKIEGNVLSLAWYLNGVDFDSMLIKHNIETIFPYAKNTSSINLFILTDSQESTNNISKQLNRLFTGYWNIKLNKD